MSALDEIQRAVLAREYWVATALKNRQDYAWNDRGDRACSSPVRRWLCKPACHWQDAAVMDCPSHEELAQYAFPTDPVDVDMEVTAHVESCRSCLEVVRIVRGARSGEGDEAHDPPSAPTPGDMVGRYVLLRGLAQGGMGKVYLGYDPVLDRNLAVKLVRPDRSDDPTFTAQLAREAQMLAKLSHPNVVGVFDAGTWRGLGYVVMEYLDGESVRGWCASESRTVAQIVKVFVGAAHGLQAAHELGLVHRDVKPDNILVAKDEIGRIGDFGLVAERPSEHPARDDGHVDPWARGGALVGTVGYRAPELTTECAPDARSDQWSFCVALGEMLYGVRPSNAEFATTRRTPAAVVRALRRGLDRDPARRFGSMTELAQALQPPRRRALYLGVAAICVVAGLAVVGVSRRGAADRFTHCELEATAAIVEAAPLGGAVFRSRFDVFGVSAAQRWTATERELESYLTRLRGQVHEACRLAEIDPPAAEVQRACIVDRRRELSALATSVQAADRAGLDQAAIALAKLPDPALCADVGRLTAVIPVEPLAKAQADQIADEVASLRARLLLGERQGIVALARAVRDWAEQLGAATVVEMACDVLAEALSRNNEPAAALDASLAAARHAARARDDRAVARHLVKAGSNAAAMLAFERAADFLTIAEVTAYRSGDPSWLRDDLDAAHGSLAIERGDARGAVPRVRALVERVRTRHGTTHPFYFTAMLQLVRALYAAREPEAGEIARAGLDQVSAAYGPDHPFAMTLHSHLGAVAVRAKDFEAMQRHHERALAIARSSFGESSPAVLDALYNLANGLGARGDRARSVSLFEQAIALGERLRDPKLYMALGTLGTSYMTAGDPERALPLLRRSLALREAAFGMESPELLNMLVMVAAASADLHEPDAARVHYRRAIAIMTRMAHPPKYAADVIHDLAELTTEPRARQQLTADAQAMERRLSEAKLAP